MLELKGRFCASSRKIQGVFSYPPHFIVEYFTSSVFPRFLSGCFLLYILTVDFLEGFLPNVEWTIPVF